MSEQITKRLGQNRCPKCGGPSIASITCFDCLTPEQKNELRSSTTIKAKTAREQVEEAYSDLSKYGAAVPLDFQPAVPTAIALRIADAHDARATENAKLKMELEQIANMCDAPHWNTERRYRIRDKARNAIL